LSTAPSEPARSPATGRSPTGAQHELRAGAARAVVTEVGGGLRSWQIDGEELLDTFAADAPADTFRGKILAPWPNRLRDGRYAFAGVEQRTPVTEPERSTALHGLVLDERFTVVRRSEAAITLDHVLRPRSGYPFTLRLEIEYALGDDALTVTLQATNLSPWPAPFGAGLHPYLRATGGRADECLLEVPAATRVPVDERMLPNGPPVPVAATPEDFARARRIGAQRLDTCFGDLRRDPDGRARVRLIPPGGAREITVWLDAAYRFVHVYTADDVADPTRRRRGVAIEPTTCAPDAFNSGDGLLVLEPGATFTGRCGLTATALP
jgi:aldose 1-epimerase